MDARDDAASTRALLRSLGVSEPVAQGGNYVLAPVTAPCPVCRHDANTILWSVTSAQAAQHFVRRDENAARFTALAQKIEALWHGPTCDVVRCTGCGFCFAHPYVAGDQSFYTLAYEHTGYPTWKWEYQITLDVMQEIVKARRRTLAVIEFGAGDGAFLARLVPAVAQAADIACTEYSDSGLAKLREQGFTVVSDATLTAPAADACGRYDAVCLFQVLEHRDDLDAVFASAHRLARPDGMLFVAVPNPAHIEFNERNGALLDMPPNHIGRWNPVCFAILAARHGWRVLTSVVDPSETLDQKASTFITYRLLREAQQPGSLAHEIACLADPGGKHALTNELGHLYVKAMGDRLAPLATPELGSALWVAFTKA